MSEPPPTFKYHPDPVKSGSIQESETECLSCERQRGYIYVGPVYAEEEIVDELCPWCIDSGAAHQKFDAEFTDAAGVGGGGKWETVANSIVDEVAFRTPGFAGWQQEQWFTCCGDAGAFLGRAGIGELRAIGDDALEAIKSDCGLDGAPWEEFSKGLSKDGSPTAYVFKCLKCGQHGGYQDCD